MQQGKIDCGQHILGQSAVNDGGPGGVLICSAKFIILIDDIHLDI